MENSFKDILLMIPDSILYGSLFYGLATVSQPHLVFFLSLIEGLALLKGFQYVSDFMNGAPRMDPEKCRSRFQGLTFTDLGEIFRSDSISYGIYILALASSYFVSSNIALKDELEVLDSSYSTRSKVTMYVLLAFTLIFAFFKVLISCDSYTSMILALLLGSVIGFFLVYQNIHLLNKNSINFIGIPLLRNKTADNQPIYVCSQ